MTPEDRKEAAVSGARKALYRVKSALNPEAFCTVCGHTEPLHRLSIRETQHAFQAGRPPVNQS